MLVSSAVDRGFEPWFVNIKTIELGFASSLLNTQLYQDYVNAKTGWLEIRIINVSEYSDRVERHVYLRTIVSVSYMTFKYMYIQ
jgi:hypothetical protein